MTTRTHTGLPEAFFAAPVDLASGTGRALEEIPILISCGSEMDDLRKVAADVLDRLNQLLRFERRSRYWFTQWNYKRDSSRDEELGHDADRSVNAVDECEGVIAIVGDGVPPTTRLEIRQVYELRKRGQDRQLWFLARKADGLVRTGDIPLADFVAEIERDYEKHEPH